jgi:predicted enzyme related to lactoylglutathione lyase
MNLDSAVFYSYDVNVAVKFYVEVIGLTLESQSGDAFASFIFDNEVRLGIKRKADDREIPGAQTIFIGIDDIEDLYDKFKENKQRFFKELTDETWGKQFSILDPDDNKILFRTKR